MKTNTVASRFVLAVLTVPAMTFVIGCSHFEKEEAKKPEIALADQEVKVVADNRIPLTQKEFESLVESQIQAHPVWAISLEQYATEEIKNEIEKFKEELKTMTPEEFFKNLEETPGIPEPGGGPEEDEGEEGDQDKEED